MPKWLFKLVKLNTNYYSFLSGVFISVSINLYTGVFSGDDIPARWMVLLASALLTLVSSLFWAIIAWELDSIQTLALSDAPDWIESIDTLKNLAIQKQRKLLVYFIISIVAALAGLGILPLGYELSKTGAVKQVCGNFQFWSLF